MPVFFRFRSDAPPDERAVGLPNVWSVPDAYSSIIPFSDTFYRDVLE
jgi:hypothetical protein